MTPTKQAKINRHHLRSAPNNCPVILQGNNGYDIGTCGAKLKDGICPTHKEVEPLIFAPIAREDAAQLVWFVRKDPWSGTITASAVESELEEYGLMSDTEVVTPKGTLPLSQFVTCKNTILTKAVPLYKLCKIGEHKVYLW